jgi:hypothetical protein
LQNKIKTQRNRNLKLAKNTTTMKKIILTLLTTCFLTSLTYSQGFVKIGADIRNGIIGSEATNNKPAFNGLYKIGFISNNGIRLNMTYENFNEIKFTRWGLEAGYVFELNKFILHTTLELSTIERKLTTSHYYNGIIVLTGGCNIEIEYNLTDHFSISMVNQIIYRNDFRIYNTKEKFVNSVFVMVTFKL